METIETKIIDGKSIAKDIRLQVGKDVALLKARGITPKLAVVLVGDDPASASYVKGKQKALVECGMADTTIYLGDATTEETLSNLIGILNQDDSVHGILVQLPLPKQISTQKIIDLIDPKKDVDGFTAINLGKMVLGEECFLPCTPAGVLELLKMSGVETNGAHVVIVGRSNIVGRPLSILLSQKSSNATVTLCHTGTKNLCDITRTADILIAAAGKVGTVTRDMVRPGAVVIDVGVNRIPDATKKSGFRLTGDCEDLSGIAKAVTPVPGGVGPMTIAMLMKNTYLAASKLIKS